MNLPLYEIWAYLQPTPLVGLTLTLAAYVVATTLYGRGREHPLLNPVLLAALLIASVVSLTPLDYATYFQGAQFVHFLLGPATIALAVPLVARGRELRRLAVPIAGGILAGGVVAAGSAVAIGWALGASGQTLRSLAPKSITAPIAMGVAERIGGLPSLAAVLVVATGILGAVAGPALLRRLGFTDVRVIGLALGTASHGIGTARAFQDGPLCGSFAGLAMAVNGAASALLIPLAFSLGALP